MTAGGPPWPALGAGPPGAIALPTGGGPRRPDPAPSGARESAQAQAAPPGTGPHAELPARLTALTRLTQIAGSRAGGGLSEDLLRRAEELVDRAGERLRLSASHTVVALAGGTGSGKSSLFNKLAGADFSAVGVTRPVTRDAHACVWGAAGSGPLLEWLAVPRRFRYSRGSALDGGEASLGGLILLDLPDHDSVVGGATKQADRLIGMADLVVWVLDPQKYADAAVHRRYLLPLAGHSDVVAVVLNQSDLLGAEEVEDCVGDLRRLLYSEGLHHVSVLVTSAVTGAGLGDLRRLLIGTVSEHRATTARISADLDGVAAEFAPHAAEQAGRPAQGGAEGEAGLVPASRVEQLTDAFSRAAGVSAVTDALRSARELRAVDFVGWPVAWLADRLTGRDPVRKIRLGRLWAELRSMTSGPSGAQQAQIDRALTDLADEVGRPLPRAWSQTSRAAVRSRAGQVPAAIGAAMAESLPDEKKITPWWRFAGALQGLLIGCEVVSLAWIAALIVVGVFHAAPAAPRMFGDISLIPWILIMIGAFLLLGWLTASGCMNLVRAAAEHEGARVRHAMREKIGIAARQLVIGPAERELGEFERFRGEFRAVAGR